MTGISNATLREAADCCDQPRDAPIGLTLELRLLPQHLTDLRKSGLSDATIEASRFYSTSNELEISRIVNMKLSDLRRWTLPVGGIGSVCVIPFRNLDGYWSDFARIRPDRPWPGKDGKPAKYIQPVGAKSRAYFGPLAIVALANPSKLVMFSEGEKKVLAIEEAGVPCIGLTGIWNGFKKREAGDTDRTLIPDLEPVNWQGRPVSIGFDTDKKRNPDVNHARAELARVLSELGADVHFVEFPVGPPDADGQPGKMGADDCLVERGPKFLRELIESAFCGPKAERSRDDYRADMLTSRIKSLDHPGPYFDGSTTGAGKSFVDAPAAEKAGASLTILQTHANCEETETFFVRDRGMNAAAYPKLDAKTCQRFPEARDVLDCGLSVPGVLCLNCPLREQCEYIAALEAADHASHRIATHSRASLGFNSIAKGRRYIAIHEDPADILRPTVELTTHLDEIQQVANSAGTEAYDHIPRDNDAWCFFNRMEESAIWLRDQLQNIASTTSLGMPPAVNKPANADACLYRAITRTGIRPSANAVRVCRAIAAGELHEVTIRVDKSITAKGRAPQIHRAIVAVWRTELPPDAAVWINDGTATREEIERLLGAEVSECTPPGRLKQIHAIHQVAVDISKGASASKFVAVLRAVLAAYPSYTRVGVICDRVHIPAIHGSSKSHNLDERCQSRIVKVEHFRSGKSRGSNRWLDECDLLVVLGTPRVPPHVVQNRLIQSGQAPAAARSGDWGPDWWAGRTLAGDCRTIKTRAYRDRAWDSAHRAIVHSELIQAFGRGRAVCENGLPVVVVTCEPLGLPLVELNGLKAIGDTEYRILAAIRPVSLQNATGLDVLGGDGASLHSLIESISECSDKSATIAERAGVCESLARRHLGKLGKAGFVARRGQRGGWILTDNGRALISTSAGPLQIATPPAGPPASEPVVVPASPASIELENGPTSDIAGPSEDDEQYVAAASDQDSGTLAFLNS